jgi:septum formation protein
MPDSLVLASGSERRHELLTIIGVRHEVDPVPIDEAVLPGEDPMSHTSRLALAKATAGSRRYPGRWVLGADTIVAFDGEILGKPQTTQEAVEMLRRLAGRRHDVVTGVALVRDGEQHVHRSSTKVWMRSYDPDLVRWYVETGEPMGKAGAYAAQGIGAVLIERIDGDFTTVIGLPVRLVFDLLRTVGVVELR